MKRIISLSLIWIFATSSMLGQSQLLPHSKLAKGCFRDSTLTYSGNGDISAKRVFHTNQSGLLESEYFYKWRGSAWVEDGIVRFVYDRRGNVIEIMKERTGQYDCSLGEYSVFTFDKFNRMTSNTYHRGSGQYWEKENETSYTYDSIGRIAESVLRMWNEDLTIFKTVHTYDSVGKEVYSLGQKWNGSVWEVSRQRIFEYDRFRNKVEELVQNWHDGAWKNSSKTQFSYDANGNQIEEIEFNWSMNQWRHFLRVITTYDNHNNPYIQLRQNWGNNGWKTMWDVHRYFNCSPLEKFGAGSNQSLKIWPNPTSGELNVSLDGIEQPLWVTVMAMNGQRVLQQSFTSTMNTEALEAGSYVIEVMTGSTIHRAQFVKK
jgi:hypothetical protein